MRSFLRPFVILLSGLALMAGPLSAFAAKTAFRIDDLNWRDPHLFVSFLGCRDITDTQLVGFSFNTQLDTLITRDMGGDGRLDLNYILVFDPLDQAASTGPFSFIDGVCTAPRATTLCWPMLTYSSTYTNMASTCLGIVPLSTFHVYTPAITLPTAPCFVASLGTVTLSLAGIPVTLQETSVAATYSGSPATGLVNGLMRGFISETNANTTIIPASYPLIGGLPLSQLFPGGDPPGTGNTNCASWSDKDTNNGVPGWYVYLNFTAGPVPLTSPPTAVRAMSNALTLDAPHPNPFNPSTEIRYVLPALAHVAMAIYDANGRVVREIANETQSRGDHTARWDGRDATGAPVSSGVYFVKLNANGETRTQKMVLLK